MDRFTVGNKVWSDSIGLAEIAFRSGNQLGLMMGDSRKMIINLEKADLRLAVASDEGMMIQSELSEQQAQQNKGTFYTHPDEDWQNQGGHLAIYNQGEDHRFLGALKSLVSRATLLTDEGGDHTLELSDDFNRGVYLASWMTELDAEQKAPEMMIILCEKGEGEGEDRSFEFASMYPYWQPSQTFQFTLKEVLVWQAGLEANLVGDIEGTDIAFFDNRYLDNQHRYQTDQCYEVRLSAHAYMMTPDQQPTEMVIEKEPDQAAAMAWLNNTSIEEERTMTIKMGNLLMGGAIDNGQDDYQFRGQVAEVMEQTFLGVECYACAILLHPDKPAFPMMLAKVHWQSEQAPYVGQQVTGSFWLTGELVSEASPQIY